MPDLFRVVFRVGTAVARTPSKRANPDGSVEWTQPLEIVVYDTNAKLVAVVQQFNFLKGWVIGPDRHFDGTSITALPDEWIHSPDLPTAPKFCAELRVDVEEDDPPPLGGIDESDQDYRGLPMLCSPRVLHYSGPQDSNGGKFKTIPSPTTTPSTLLTTSVGGGFFGDGSRTGVYSEESSPAGSSVPSESPPRSPLVNPTTTPPPPYEELVRERGTLGSAAGAVGAPVALRPEVAVSRSFSWSPLMSYVAQQPVDAPTTEHQGSATAPGDEEACCVAQRAGTPPATEHPRGETEPGDDDEPPLLEKLSRLFSWSPLDPPAALPEDAAAAPQQQRDVHEAAAAGAATSSECSTPPRFSPLLPQVSPLSAPNDPPAEAQNRSGRGSVTTKPNPRANVTDERRHNDLVSSKQGIVIKSSTYIDRIVQTE